MTDQDKLWTDLRELARTLGNFNDLRVIEAHHDLATLASLHAEATDRASDQARRAGDPPNQDPQVLAAALSLGRQADALLRAAIVFGDVAVSTLLQETAGPPRRDITVRILTGTKLADRPWREWATTLSIDALTTAHALRIYRNKVIMHFAVETTRAVTWHRSNWRDRRLIPLELEAAPPGRHAALEDLARSYAHEPRVAALPEVAPGRRNYFELLEALFYTIPPLTGAEANPDRKFIDDLLDYGGVKSPTMTEVLQVVHNFSRTVIDSLANGQLPPTRQQPPLHTYTQEPITQDPFLPRSISALRLEAWADALRNSLDVMEAGEGFPDDLRLRLRTTLADIEARARS